MIFISNKKIKKNASRFLEAKNRLEFFFKLLYYRIVFAIVFDCYMGGISQDVKWQKCGIFTLYSLDFLDHLHFCCFDDNYHGF